MVGSNMKTTMDESVCPWWTGPCLFEVLDSIEVPPRDPNDPFRYGNDLDLPLGCQLGFSFSPSKSDDVGLMNFSLFQHRFSFNVF